ncbi:immunity protein TriTu family protein [Pseudoalteromonas rubra]|uniref:immunity protein TriTu family protein n=1 Tax=Pseudoalteromonas rubra TaxID=43658 RepID=UPI000F7B12C3|nr:hypothetical protein [Pseudoalteromonas rubra]
MNELLSYLEDWKNSKTKIFVSEGYDVTITDILGESKKARYIDLDTDKLVSRATLWETGELEIEAIDIHSEKQVIQLSAFALQVCELDDKLNWWLSEVATY